MPGARQKFFVGLFVIAGGALIVLSMLLLGLSEFFNDDRRYVAYFEDSVRGLNPSAEVSFKGVEVGRVDSINLAPDREHVEVILLVDSQIKDPSSLIATIRSLGVTGIMYVELERRPPEKPPSPVELDFDPEYPVIETRPSEISQMIAGVNEIVNNLREVKIREISAGIENAIDNFNKVMVEAEVREISAGLRDAIEKSNAILEMDQWRDAAVQIDAASKDFRNLMETVDRSAKRVDMFFEHSAEDMERSIAMAGEAVENATLFFDRAAFMTEDAHKRMDTWDQSLTVVVGDLQQAAKSLNRLLEQLESHPSQLLFGRPAPPKPIEK